MLGIGKDTKNVRTTADNEIRVRNVVKKDMFVFNMVGIDKH